MTVEVIRQIKSAEEKADQIKNNAIDEARKIIKDAKEKGQDIIKDAVSIGRKKAEDIIKNEEEQGQKEIVIHKKENDKKCQQIKDKAEVNMDKATSFILGRIVETHGNS